MKRSILLVLVGLAILVGLVVVFTQKKNETTPQETPSGTVTTSGEDSSSIDSSEGAVDEGGVEGGRSDGSAPVGRTEGDGASDGADRAADHSEKRPEQTQSEHSDKGSEKVSGKADAERGAESTGAAPTDGSRSRTKAKPDAASASKAAGGFSDAPAKKEVESETTGMDGGDTTVAGGSGPLVGGGPLIQQPGFNDGPDGVGARSTVGEDDTRDASRKTSEKPKGPVSIYGVKHPKVWLVASDLRELPNASRTFEVGAPEGSKKTPWKNRAGSKSGDGVRTASGASATFLRSFPFRNGSYDTVEFCSPGTKDCLGSAPSQIKSGVDMNHSEHWLSGADRAGKTTKGGGSFTVLFVAARGSSNPNPLLEHQNGEANGKKGPFLGWIGPDLVGSIHGSQGIVSISAVAIPSGWTPGPPSPEIYSLRFDRKKQDLRIFALTEKGSEAKSVKLAKGEGPDNDQYAAVTIGSKNPGEGAVTYVLEHAAFSRALPDSDLCKIHRGWAKKYGIKVPSGSMKPCEG